MEYLSGKISISSSFDCFQWAFIMYFHQLHISLPFHLFRLLLFGSPFCRLDYGSIFLWNLIFVARIGPIVVKFNAWWRGGSFVRGS